MGATNVGDALDANTEAVMVLRELFAYQPGGLANAGLTLRWHNGFRVYQDGTYRTVSDADMRARVAGHLVGQNVRVTHRLLGDVLDVLAGIVRIDDQLEPPCWLEGVNGAEVITFRNGNYSLTDRRLLPHTPLYYSLLAPLPFDYDPAATCPQFDQFLADVMQGDAEYIALLQEFLGYLFIPGNPYQMFLLFLGPGANGKTTLVRVMEWLAGPANVSHVPLCRFGDRFSLTDMVGKRLNTATETIRTVDDETEARLKELTGGDTLAAERKFVQGRINFTPSAKIVIATNEMPRFRDKSSGLWRRLWLVPFRVSIAEDRQDPILVEKLRAEGPGIFNLALDARDRFLAQGGFTVPSERASLLEQIRRDLDPVREFLTMTYQESANGESVGCTEMYLAYTDWTHALGVRLVDERYFGRRVRDVFPASERRQRGGRGRQT